jgi:dynamin GTPase
MVRCILIRVVRSFLNDENEIHVTVERKVWQLKERKESISNIIDEGEVVHVVFFFSCKNLVRFRKFQIESEIVTDWKLPRGTVMANQPGNPNMKMLIPMINELQRIFMKVNTRMTLTLPQIAVIGSQSAGKSSVLENIVGRDFLPRGGSMVTKRPLVLQLITSQGQEYGVFGHKPQHRFTNYADIRNEIENDTKAVVRDDMGVSNIPINLTIYSPHVINLTLVDLPGMVKVPSQGQPLDIVKKIDDIILEYISNENCLILAVTPANVDIVTSDALVMARSRDPMGKRTIGVLTKLDMMGRGHNARDVLLNKVVVLERGFIGVVLRGQRVDDSGRTMRELDIPAALEFERQFFLNDPSYRDIADRMGVPYLQRTLSIQLTEHILKCLPDLKRELQGRHRDLSKEVSEYRTSAISDGSGFDTKALVILTHELQEDFDTSLRGTHLKESDLKTLTGGARIASIFRDRFPAELVNSELQSEDMRTQLIVVIKNIRSTRAGLFVPDEAFECMVRMQIAKFEEPIIKCVDMVVSELMLIIHEVTSKMKRYPLLQHTIEELLSQYLKEREAVTKQECSLYINTQLSYINTIHEDFIGFASAEKSTSDSGEAKRHITNQVIYKGFLRVHTGVKLFQAKEYFCVLSTDNFSWFSDSDEREKKYMLPVENLRLRDIEGGSKSKRSSFALFNTRGNNIYKEHKMLELSVDNTGKLEHWKASFFRAGVYPEREQRAETTTTSADAAPEDPHMERQVETISILVTSYMRIVTKMTRDFIPKTIAYNIVQELRKYVSRELLANLYTVPDPKSLLQESIEERQRREAKIAEFEAVKGALSIIENFHLNARKVTTDVMPTSAVTTHFPNTITNNHFEQSLMNRADRNGSMTPPIPQYPIPSVPPRPFDRPPVPQRN